MKADFRFAWLVLSISVCFLFQPVLVLAGTFAVEPGGYIAGGLDHYGAFWDEDGEPETTQGILRNAKLEFEFSVGDAWEAEVDGSYEWKGGDRDLDLGDAYVEYRGWESLKLRLGRFKEPFGFERLESYSRLVTSERSMATSSFAPGRSQGLVFGQAHESKTLELGVFTNEPEGESSRAVTGRVTLAPVHDNNRLVHLGVAGSWRNYKGDRFQIKDDGEVPSADNIVRSARFDAQESILGGLEFAGIVGRYTLVSEFMMQRVRRDTGQWWTFSGSYLQLSAFISDDHRKYRRGGLRRVKPASTLGALEVVMRYSTVDLRDHGLGAEASTTLIGLAYYLGKSFQLRLNHLFPEISGNALSPAPDGSATTVRVVLRF
ncbi:MAG: porin [Gammaproteobacteria bacterium]|nr:MAG: porin [Gammaproteobacteria bacterium]